MGNKLLKVAVVMALAMAGTAGASWLAGLLTMTGHVTSTGGVAENMTWAFDTETVTIIAGANSTTTTTWNNPDGAHDYTFDYTDVVTSSTGDCEYQPGVDYTYAVRVNGLTKAMPYTHTMQSGQNNISITYSGSPTMCPLSGTMQLTATRQ